jgi:pyruvate,water dikinase
MTRMSPIVWFETLGRGDGAVVGGKNASLGEMVRHLAGEGVKVPTGFATIADAYWRFVDANGLRDIISSSLNDLETGKLTLAEVGATLRQAFLHGSWPDELAASITTAYQELGRRSGKTDPDVAVRSSATAEDLPDASFAGQQEVSQYSRRTGFAGCLPALLCVAVYGSRHLLS